LTECSLNLLQERDVNLLAGNWLEDQLAKVESNRDGQALLIPRKNDGTRFELCDLQGDQRNVAAYVLEKLYFWVRDIERDDVKVSELKPLRMTVVGAAGTGKSVLINALVTVLREMFQTTDSVFVGAPTGSAAFKAFGETLHRLFAIPVRSAGAAEMHPLSGVKRGLLSARYQRSLVGIFDERSLIALSSLGYASHNFRQTVFNGRYQGDDSFGGIPILLLVGDDYQLPPVSRGVFDIPLDTMYDESKVRHFSRAEIIGMDIFHECSKDVMVLTKKKRQSEGQDEYRRILDASRTSCLSTEDADKLIDELHLVRGKYTAEDRAAIEADALFLSANREPVDEYNFMRLATVCSKENPVAIVKSKTQGKNEVGVSSHFDSGCPATAHLCIGAKVSLQGRNFNPAWGLFNGSIGTVREIVFSPDDNPNDGDQPLYVVVEFNSYCGPAWDESNPKVRTYTESRWLVVVLVFSAVTCLRLPLVHSAFQYLALLISALDSVANGHHVL
jgi:hypothetical protein